MNSVAYKRVQQFIKAAGVSTEESKTERLFSRACEEIRAALERDKFNREEIPEMQQLLREIRN